MPPLDSSGQSGSLSQWYLHREKRFLRKTSRSVLGIGHRSLGYEITNDFRGDTTYFINNIIKINISKNHIPKNNRFSRIILNNVLIRSYLSNSDTVRKHRSP
jgi:hypothetical protein